MAGRQLGPEERALWARVAETVRALHPRAARPAALTASEPLAAPCPRPASAAPPPPSSARRTGPGETLDGRWDRQLRRGAVAPDRTIDLHGHSLAHAHAALDAGLGAALARGERLLLVVTGRPPRKDRPGGRGAIRASLGEWLAVSGHAGRIAAVRGAHPRHGGAGALYVVLRREK